MPQMTPPGRTTPPPRVRNLAEEIHNYLGIVRRGWRLIAITVVIALTAATIYLEQISIE